MVGGEGRKEWTCEPSGDDKEKADDGFFDTDNKDEDVG
jgi:hypothetical protein